MRHITCSVKRVRDAFAATLRRTCLPLVVAVTIAMVPGVALAHEETTSIAAGTRLSYLFAVTLVTWFGFFAYALYTSRKQQELQRQLDVLLRTLANRESSRH